MPLPAPAHSIIISMRHFITRVVFQDDLFSGAPRGVVGDGSTTMAANM